MSGKIEESMANTSRFEDVPGNAQEETNISHVESKITRDTKPDFVKKEKPTRNKDNIETQIESSDMTHNIMNGKVTIEKKPIRDSINLISEEDANKRNSTRLFEEGDRGAQAGIMDNEIKSDKNEASSTPPQESKQIYSESDIKHAPVKISDRFKGVQTSQKSEKCEGKTTQTPQLCRRHGKSCGDTAINFCV